MFYIKILADGPYLVYGNPPIDQEIIMPNEDGASWVYKKRRHYKTEGEYTALCRCGESCKKPFCDGSHSKADWNPEPILHSICAFANDIDNWGGGYIIIGIEDEDGMPKFPIKGLEKARLTGSIKSF